MLKKILCWNHGNAGFEQVKRRGQKKNCRDVSRFRFVSFCWKIIHFEVMLLWLIIVLFTQAGDMPNEEFELLKLKIEQLREAEKVKTNNTTGCLLSLSTGFSIHKIETRSLSVIAVVLFIIRCKHFWGQIQIESLKLGDCCIVEIYSAENCASRLGILCRRFCFFIYLFFCLNARKNFNSLIKLPKLINTAFFWITCLY